jgi:outer membrane protein TolC
MFLKNKRASEFLMLLVVSSLMLSIIFLEISAGAVESRSPLPKYPLPKVNLPFLTLERAVEIGLKNQPSLKAMEAQRNMAAYEVDISRTQFFPMFSANSFLTKADFPTIFDSVSPSTPSYSLLVPGESFWNQNFSVMLPLFTGGRNTGTLKKSRLEKEAADYDYRAARLDLILQIKTGYRIALYFRELRQTYEELVKESEARAKVDRVSYEAGKVAYANVLRNEARLAQSKQMLTNTEKDYQTALVQLRTLMGVDSRSVIDLAKEPLEPEKANLTREQSLNTALNNRPDILALSQRLKAANEDLTVSRSDLYPQIAFSATYDIFKGADDSSDSAYSAGLLVSFPFFRSGETFHKINQSRENLKQAEYNYQAEILKTQAEVDSAWLALQAAAKNIETARAGVVQAEEDFRIIKLAYEAGKKIQVEYLDAQVALFQAKTDYAKAILDYNMSVDQLNRVLGKE